jgi:parvulin-like peptidyl-prolyl isomerase
VRFAGARNAGPEITRSHDEAQALASQIRERLVAPGADFLAIAREVSEDTSRERGGDMGWLGRGRLSPAYEQAAFGMNVGAISEPVETEFGFHLIQRVQ